MSHYRASLLDDETSLVAVEFENGGKALARQDSALAANLFHRAADWYAQAGLTGDVRRCRQNATRVAYGPYIHVHAVNLPPEWEEGYAQQVVIELVNHGQVSASDLWIRLAGILEARVWVQVEFLQAGKRVEIEAPLAARSSGDLVVFVEYAGRDGRRWSLSQPFPVIVRPSSYDVDIVGDVGALKLEGLEKKVRVHGDVGHVRVTAGDQPSTIKEPGETSE